MEGVVPSGLIFSEVLLLPFSLEPAHLSLFPQGKGALPLSAGRKVSDGWMLSRGTSHFRSDATNTCRLLSFGCFTPQTASSINGVFFSLLADTQTIVVQTTQTLRKPSAFHGQFRRRRLKFSQHGRMLIPADGGKQSKLGTKRNRSPL